MKTQSLKATTVALLLSLTACGAVGKSATELAAQSIDNLGCKLSQSEMWSELHKIAEQGGQYPQAEELRAALLDVGQKRGLKGQAFENFVNAFVNNYAITVQGIQEKLAPQTVADWKKALAEMEVGVKITSVHAELSSKIEKSLEALSVAEEQMGQSCSNPAADQPAPAVTLPSGSGSTPKSSFENVWEQLMDQDGPEVFGARKTLATAYQSCDVLSLPAMTSSTPPVKGIEILPERHPAGGLKRVIPNKATVNASHYYIQGNRLAKSSCFEIRNNPLIYDFGGKPYTSANQPQVLNMFRDGGSGTSVLGIDCSAYVFSALALAGLKMDPDPKKVLKADLVHGIGSRAFKEPQSNGLRCLAKASMTAQTSILAGDVVAINGHVVMIDHIGEDPFGLARARSVSDCKASVLKSSGFDFVIAQSSPSKDGIGINRYQAKDYLGTSGTYKTGLEAYAVAACRAHFGASANLNSPDLSVVRHKKTPECLAAPLHSENESCVDSCRPL